MLWNFPTRLSKRNVAKTQTREMSGLSLLFKITVHHQLKSLKIKYKDMRDTIEVSTLTCSHNIWSSQLDVKVVVDT